MNPWFCPWHCNSDSLKFLKSDVTFDLSRYSKSKSTGTAGSISFIQNLIGNHTVLEEDSIEAPRFDHRIRTLVFQKSQRVLIISFDIPNHIFAEVEVRFVPSRCELERIELLVQDSIETSTTAIFASESVQSETSNRISYICKGEFD